MELVVGGVGLFLNALILHCLNVLLDLVEGVPDMGSVIRMGLVRWVVDEEQRD